MAILVCCPCGNPLDCDHLELVITLTCPRCQRELALEVEYPPKQRCHAMLTVEEGPYWVDEKFVMPVGEELLLGKAQGNWLSLGSEQLSDVHCRLRLSPNGHVEIEDLSKNRGTWIGQASILKGRLKPRQAFTIGEYRLRLDLRSVDASGSSSHSAFDAGEVERPRHSQVGALRPLPALKRVAPDRTVGGWLVSNRFQAARWMILAFGWSVSVYFFFSLIAGPTPWRPFQALAVGLVFLAALVASARSLTLAHSSLKYLPLGVLVVIGIVEIIWGRPVAAIAGFLLASATTLLIALIPSRAVAVFALVLSVVCMGIMLFLIVGSILVAAA